MASTSDSPSGPVKFRFKKIGPIKEAELELGGLTIVAGRNNTGKTYLAYTLYGFLKMWKWWPYAENFLMGGDEELTDTEADSQVVDEKYFYRVGIAKDVIEDGLAKRSVDRDTLDRVRNATARFLAGAYSEIALADALSASDSDFEEASIEVELTGDFPRGERALSQTNPTGDVLSIGYDGNVIVMAKGSAKKQSDDTIQSARDLANLYLQFLLPELSYEPFVLSAERFGISLFYRELDFTKNRLVELLQQMGDDKDSERFSPYFIIDRTTSRYALPIKDNIDYTRSIPDLQNERSEFYDDKLFDNIKDMMEGYYRASDDGIRFISKARKERRFTIPLHRVSSSARGLSDLYFFLRHVARKDHLLIIDEPESHLDTANQIQLARLLARCVRAGLKVLITTHSDYLIKELNNLIMLSRPFSDKEEVVSKLRYQEDDFLAPESVRAYVAEDNTLRRCGVDAFGIEMPVFDETIDQINTAANELASRLAEDNVQ